MSKTVNVLFLTRGVGTTAMESENLMAGMDAITSQNLWKVAHAPLSKEEGNSQLNRHNLGSDVRFPNHDGSCQIVRNANFIHLSYQREPTTAKSPPFLCLQFLLLVTSLGGDFPLNFELHRFFLSPPFESSKSSKCHPPPINAQDPPAAQGSNQSSQ